jgi:hypothetical protein
MYKNVFNSDENGLIAAAVCAVLNMWSFQQS